MNYEIEEMKNEIAELEEKTSALRERLEEKAETLVATTEAPPVWLKNLIVTVAQSIGIRPDDFEQEIEISHPTPSDPVLVVRGRPVLAWV